MLEINTQEELNALLEKGPVVLDFYAAWCAPCKQLVPILESVEENNSDITFAKCNVDSAHDLAVKYHVNAIPQINFFKNGENVHTVVGMQANIQDTIDNILKG